MGTIKNTVYGLAFVLGVLPPGCWAQDPNSDPESDASRTWMFDMPGSSYMSSYPDLVNKQNLSWRFEFKTRQPNTLLFHHEVDMYNRREFPRLNDYELYWQIKHGSLHMVHRLNKWKDELTIGIALSDDRWHRVWVSVDGVSGQTVMRLDNQTQTFQLKAYTGWEKAGDILVWSNLSTIASFGGTERPIAFGYQTFVGCMRDLQYLNHQGKYEDVNLQSKSGVTKGCLNLCTGPNPCHNGGRCISQYTQAVCDCFSTGYEGSTCQIPGSTVVTLQGFDYIVYRSYAEQQDWANRDKSRFSFEFKTQRGSGVVLYAMGTSPTNNHVIVTLFAGSVHVSVSFGAENLDVEMGIGLDNNRWHNLTINHQGPLVEVYLDRVVRRKRAKGSNHYLSLDPNIYFGGGYNFVVTRGLKVTQNFVGCLRNLYVDEVSVLYNMNQGLNKTMYAGPKGKMKKRCLPVDDPPLTFPRSGTMLLVNSDSNHRLSIQLEFRTVRPDAVLVHTELISPDRAVGYDIGILEVWLSRGEVMLHYAPSTRFNNYTQDILIEGKVNDAMWHSLHLSYVNSQVWLGLDGVQVISDRYDKSLPHREKIVIGHGLRKLKSGFVGCMRRLKVQGRTIDPLVIVDTKGSVGLRLDGCELTDRCKGVQLCEHGSSCVSNWESTECDCSRVPYEGKTCHFAKKLRSCDDYYQSGWRASGVYLIDPDGNGPLRPVYVKCNMGYTLDQESYGMTVIEHNLPFNHTARATGKDGRRFLISYRGVDRYTLEALTNSSLGCHQHITYTCNDAKLSLGKLTWFKAANGQVVDYLGSGDHGECSCARNNSCRVGNHLCNCDAGLSHWSEDRGFNSVKDQLPITEMVFLKDKGDGKITLGPLQCWGNKNHAWDTAVTFRSSESYVPAPPWKTGDLEISFKTTETSATILYQTSKEDPGSYFTIKIMDGRKVDFSYNINGHTKRKVIVSKDSISDGLWQQIRIEHDRHNVRFTVNKGSKLVRLDPGERLGGFDGLMYIGSAGPSKTGSSGIIGCVRGLVYNNRQTDLVSYAADSGPNVEVGCTASCQSSPCKHGAICVEDWGQYTCECLNDWSHLGSNCQQNIDEDMATIDGQEGSYLQFNLTDNGHLLQGTIVFSFRTYQSQALLFYMYDHFNNFLQLELRNAQELLLKFNSQTYVTEEFISIGGLNDGQWKQVVLQRLKAGTMKLQCGDVNKIILQRQTRLKTYLARPFAASDSESILPVRLSVPPDMFVRVYVGGVPPEMTTLTSPPTLHGCVTGFRSNQHIFDLQSAAKERNGTAMGCVSGCDKEACQNNGACVELWQGEYQCDCLRSYYTGKTCQTDPSAVLNGEMVVVYKANVRSSSFAASSSTEKLMLEFTANSSVKTNMVLVFVYSSVSNDYILTYLTPVGDVVVETNLGAGTYVVKKPGEFVDDRKHTLEYRRRQKELILKLDRSPAETVVYPEYTIDEIDTIMVGGVLVDDPRFFGKQNFSGCLSDVVYYPTGRGLLQFRPLKELHREPAQDTVHAWGGHPEPCIPTPPIMEKPQNENPASVSPAPLPPEVLTLPPWNKKVETIIIPSTQIPVATNNTRIIPVITASADYLTIIIAVTLVVFLLIIALIFALIMLRMRRRRETYSVEKEPGEYHELKRPLNHTPETGKIHRTTQMPINHLATMDEFSLVSGGTLDRMHSEDHLEPNNLGYPRLSPTEDEALLNPPLNRKTNRPASSISEVLEEMDRRRKAKALGLDPDAVVPVSTSPGSAHSLQMHGEGELEWDPQTDHTPLSCDVSLISDFDILDLLQHFCQDEKKELPDEARETSSHHSDSPVTGVEFNGDSGYEAGSKPEVEELGDATSSPDTHKLYRYDLAALNSESLLQGDGVKTRLITVEAETAC